MHVPINVKSPNNISEWQMGFNSAFKGLKKTLINNGYEFKKYFSVMEVITKQVSLSSNACEIYSESFRFELISAVRSLPHPILWSWG